MSRKGDDLGRIQQTEREFSDAVVEYARLCGWLVHRDPTWRATGTDPGYPDLTLLRGDGRGPLNMHTAMLIFAELKTEKGRVTAPQKQWLDGLYDLLCGACGRQHVMHYIWRPSDWPEIEKVLR